MGAASCSSCGSRGSTNFGCPVYESHHFNSTKWKQISHRPDDIVIVTAYKSGTTWMQQIVAELLFQGKEKPASVGDMSPWVDLRVPPAEVIGPAVDNMTWRRFLKTHLPADAFEPYFSTSTKYVYVGRDGRDAFMSLMHHYETGNEVWYGALNDSPGLVGPPLPRYSEVGPEAKIFDRWLTEGWPTLSGEKDGWPFWSFFHNAKSWWEKGQDHPNILFVHFNNLKADLQGEMLRVAKFLDIDVDRTLLPTIVKACTFDAMHKKADEIAPLNGAMWKNGGTDFIYKGTNHRWKGVLSEVQLMAYETKVKQSLPPKCAEWIATGKLQKVQFENAS